MGILVCVPLPAFRDPTSQSKMLGLEIFPHPTCEVKGSGDCEFLHPISHMASEKWEVRLKREFPFLKYLPLDCAKLKPRRDRQAGVSVGEIRNAMFAVFTKSRKGKEGTSWKAKSVCVYCIS